VEEEAHLRSEAASSVDAARRLAVGLRGRVTEITQARGAFSSGRLQPAAVGGRPTGAEKETK
jgi:hypothetical protein